VKLASWRGASRESRLGGWLGGRRLGRKPRSPRGRWLIATEGSRSCRGREPRPRTGCDRDLRNNLAASRAAESLGAQLNSWAGGIRISRPRPIAIETISARAVRRPKSTPVSCRWTWRLAESRRRRGWGAEFGYRRRHRAADGDCRVFRSVPVLEGCGTVCFATAGPGLLAATRGGVDSWDGAMAGGPFPA